MMNLAEAEGILGGNRATWELENMRKALGFMGLFNTPEEDRRLEAAKVILREQRKASGRVSN